MPPRTSDDRRAEAIRVAESIGLTRVGWDDGEADLSDAPTDAIEAQLRRRGLLPSEPESAPERTVDTSETMAVKSAADAGA